MSDPFQSQVPKKIIKSAKTVQVVKPGQKDEVVSGENLNSVALQFIRQWKKQRAAQE